MSETIFIEGETGVVFEMSVPLSPPIEDRLHKGYLKRVNADGTPYKDRVAKRKPYANEPKADWVSWAVHKGMTPDDADSLTKTDLIEKFGAV